MRKLLSRRLILIVSLLAVFIFFVNLFQLKILPLKYIVPLIIIIIFLMFLLYVLEKDNNGRNNVKSIIVKFVHILLSVAFVVGSISIMRGNRFLSAITGSKNQIMEVDVIVLKSSSYENINDLKGKTFGINNAIDMVNMNKAVAKLEDKIDSMNLKEYNQYDLLIQSLNSHASQAILVKSVDLDMLDGINKGFSNQIKIIDKIEVVLPSIQATAAKVTKEPFNVFITGRDKSGPIDTFSLSDVNMIATINPNTKQILLTSIPRDYYVDIIGMDGVTGKDKLTHSARGGTDVSIKTVENFMGVDMNYYAKFNFTSFLNVVDALGGIDVNVPKYDVIGRKDGVFTTVKGHYKIKPGLNHFNSKQALGFVRERKAFVLGDEIRGKNQMLMLKAIIKKCTSPDMIVNMNRVFNTLESSFETNMQASDIQDLIKMQINDMASWDIQTYHLDGDSSQRVTQLAISGDVSKINPKGVFVSNPKQESIDQAKEYIRIVMEGNEILKIKD